MTTAYEVIAGNIGCVYAGPDAETAIEMFQLYVTDSKNNYGRVAGEPVTLIKDGEIRREYQGTNPTE